MPTSRRPRPRSPPILTAKSILADDPSDLVKGASQLPGCFTLEGWSTFQENLEKALDGTLVSQDWVLSCGSAEHGHHGRRPRRQPGAPDRRSTRPSSTSSEKFLGGSIAIRDVKGAADALGRLSDTRHSPIRLILLRAVKETYIDKPSLVNPG